MQKMINSPIMIVLIISQFFLSACGSEQDLYFENAQIGGNETTDGLEATYGGTVQNGLRLNNLRVLEKIIVPYVAKEFGVEEIEAGESSFFSYAGTRFIPSVNIGMKSFDMDINIDDDTASFDIIHGGLLESVFDLDSWDPTLITYIRVGKFIEINPEFSLKDLKATLVSSLKADTTEHRVQIGHIESIEVELTDAVIISGGLTWAYDLACRIVNWVAPAMCDDGDDCISSILNKAMRAYPIAQKTIKSLINDSLDTALQISDDVSISEHPFTYDIGLSKLKPTNHPDIIFTQWSTVLKGTYSSADASCEPALYHNESTAYYDETRRIPDDVPSLGAIDLVVPYGLLADAIVLLAKSGKFCESHNIPCGVKGIDFQVVPAGQVRILPGETFERADLEMPFRIDLFDGDERLSSSLEGTFAYELRGAINTAKQEFHIRFGHPRITSLEGSVSTSCGTIDGPGMAAFLNPILGFLKIEPIILPKTMGLTGNPEEANTMYLDLVDVQFQNTVVRFASDVCLTPSGFSWSGSKEDRCVSAPRVMLGAFSDASSTTKPGLSLK
ncbi:MAG: hypothetical protein QGI45_06230 [Myxococcota bacterium]|jgi:hypothetical protein|nr:hypothetical protein [Myxococcota bacterium]